MVRGVLGLVYKEVRGLHQAAYVLALFTFASQMLALIRDRLLAHQFGAGEMLDIYYSAFRIPDILFVLFASSLSVYVLIPFVTKKQTVENDQVASNLLSNIANLFLLSYAVVAGILVLTAGQYVPILFPGIVDTETLVLLVRILLLQPLFLGLSNLFGVLTQLSHRFVLFALCPLFYNAGIIIGIIFLYPLMGIAGLAWGVVLGAMGHLAIQLPLLSRSSIKINLFTKFSLLGIKPVLLTSFPRALTLSCNQLVLLVLVSLAGTLTVGSVAVFQFAYNLQSVPLAIIGVSYSVAAFPTLSKIYSDNKLTEFSEYLTLALRHIIFWSVPILVLCIILRAQLVRVVLGSGFFNWEDTRLTAAVFAILVVSIASSGIQLLLVRAFYAAGNTRIPLLVNVISSALAVVLLWQVSNWYDSSLPLAHYISVILRVKDVAGTEIVALAIVYMAVLVIQTNVLVILAKRKFAFSLRPVTKQLSQSLFAALCGGVSAYTALQFFVAGLNTDTFIGIFLQGTLAGLFGVAGIIIGYILVGSKEIKEVYSAINRRIFKVSVVAPENDLL